MRRKKIRLKYKKERAILSDVLPYELPLIFSNRYFYRFLVKNEIRIDIEKNELFWKKDIDVGALNILALIFNTPVTELNGKQCLSIGKSDLKTIPFVYSIQHKPTKNRYLSLIHPANQIKVVDFYNRYKDTILYLCSKSNFSIRYPNKVACYFYYKDRLHHILLGKKTDKMEMYFSEYENLKTYFSYNKYTNIHKFYEDYRYQRAEKKFLHLRKMDIQSCFDSIYTHSIAWAISGGSSIYKDTFEGKSDGSIGAEWDKMMQEMNYNETNGIVIGPEFSRLFAEVIFQHIDQQVERTLLELGYRNKADYECYRYVDDYFLFYNDEKVRVELEKALQIKLKEFKLSISHEKTTTIERPFITPITKAKIAIDDLLNESIKLYGNFDEEIDVEKEEDVDHSDIDTTEIDEEVLVKVDREKLTQSLNTDLNFRIKAVDFNKRFKEIVDSNEVDYKDVLNYTFARLSTRLERTLRKFDKTYKVLCQGLDKAELTDLHPEAEKKRTQLEKGITNFLFQVLDSVFFLYSNSKRINTTLKTIQILNHIKIYLDNNYVIKKGKSSQTVKRFTEYAREIVFKKIRDEIGLVFQAAPIDDTIQLETLYFLIVLRGMNAKYHLSAREIEKYIGIKADDSNTMQFPKLNALSTIILFYYFGRSECYEELRKGLLEHVLKQMSSIPKNRRHISSECVILALDMAACPYILPSERTKLLQQVGASRKTGDSIVEYMKHQKFMFTKWTGIDITKELNAKISQEVYS